MNKTELFCLPIRKVNRNNFMNFDRCFNKKEDSATCVGSFFQQKQKQKRRKELFSQQYNKIVY